MGQQRARWIMWTVLAATVMVIAMSDGVAAQSGSDKAVAHVDLQFFSNDQWDISARSNFNGSQPSGSWRATFMNQDPNLVVSGEITCLQVANGVALVGGIVTNVRGGTTTAMGMWAAMTDMGKFSTSPDLFRAFLIFGPPEAIGACPSPAAFSQQPVIDGEVIVQDAMN